MTNPETLVLTGVSWRDRSPFLRLRRNQMPSQLVPLVGFSANYSTGPTATRHCIGHKPFREADVTWLDCDRPPLHDGRTCDRCAASDATFASQLHHAHNKGASELDAAVRKHLEQPNQLYLAAFRDGSIKVGTSTEPRLDTRLDEQGAWIAEIVASTTDGFAVRTLEDRVTIELGLPQSVSTGRKLSGVTRPKPDEQLRQELALWAPRVADLVDQMKDPRIEKLSTRWESPAVDDPVFTDVHAYPLKVESGNHDLELLAASGRIAVAHRPGSTDRFAIDLRRLFGVELTLGGAAPDELAVQDSLF